MSQTYKREIIKKSSGWFKADSGTNAAGAWRIISKALGKIAHFYDDPGAAIIAYPNLMLYNFTSTPSVQRVFDRNLTLQETLALGIVEHFTLEEHLSQNSSPKPKVIENAWSDFMNDTSDTGVIKTQLAVKVWKRLNLAKIASGKSFTSPDLLPKLNQAISDYGNEQVPVLVNLSHWRLWNCAANESVFKDARSTDAFLYTLSGKIDSGNWFSHENQLRNTATELVIYAHPESLDNQPLTSATKAQLAREFDAIYSKFMPEAESTNATNSWLEHRTAFLQATTPLSLKSPLTFKDRNNVATEVFDLTPARQEVKVVEQPKLPVPDPKPVDSRLKNLSEKAAWDAVRDFSEKLVKIVAKMFTKTLMCSKYPGIWNPKNGLPFTTKDVRRVFTVSMDNEDLTRQFRELDPAWVPPQGIKNARHLAFNLTMALMCNGAADEMLSNRLNAKLMNPEEWVDYLVYGPSEIIR